jgi:hypothetical protein
MPLDATNIETIIRLIVAHQQRYTEIADLGGRLLLPAFWRSRDGTLELGTLTQDDKTQLTARLTDLLDEAQVIANNIRQALGP